MRVVVLYNQSSEDAAVEDRDVLAQRDAVLAAAARLGHEAEHMACSLDLAAARMQLEALRPDVVFNLVESLGGTDRLMVLGTLLLDAMNLAYTGSGTSALLATTSKLAAKQRLQQAGLPTPVWFSLPTSDRPPAAADQSRQLEPSVAPLDRVIVKPVWEHASWGLDDDAILAMPDVGELERRIRQRSRATGRPHFAEQFIDGREFNLSLLETIGPNRPGDAIVGSSGDWPANVEVLSPAEIDFSELSADKPRIVGYRAKWDEQSDEYQQTPRRFDFPPQDAGLLDELRGLARDCWRLFGLSGYARVDFRVDRQGRPWILEVNVNPCLSPDAGFAAAVERQGIGYDQAIERIIAAATDAAR